MEEVDAAVVARARRGDRGAFAAVVRHYDAGLRALAYRLLGDRERMDDALQEAYVRAFRGLPRFRGGSSLGTWLYRIAYNACIDEPRQTADVVPLELVRERPDRRSGVAERAAASGDLAAALASLPPAERAAVILVDAQGFDYREAAAVLDVPPGTLASRLNRARGRLRQALAGDTKGAASP